MKLIKLKYSDSYLVASAVASMEIFDRMESEGLPRDEVESYLEDRTKELVKQYEGNRDYFLKKVEEIKGNSGFMDLIRNIQSNPFDAFASDVLGYIKEKILSFSTTDVDPNSGTLKNVHQGDFVLIPTEEFALASYKATMELQKDGKEYGDEEWHQNFNQLVHQYSESYLSDQKFFLKEFSEMVPEGKHEDLSRLANHWLSSAIESAEKNKMLRSFVLSGLEKKFCRFYKLGD